MPKRAVAYLSGVGYGTIKYTLTPLEDGKARVEVDISTSRLDDLPELKEEILKPFEGGTEKILDKDEALQVLKQFISWAAISGTVVPGSEEDTIFMQHDVVAAVARWEEARQKQEAEANQAEGDGASSAGVVSPQVAGGTASESSTPEVIAGFDELESEE